MTAVRRKLEEIWEQRLSSLKTSKIEAFYLQGIDALDWEKLSSSIGEAYTAEEIASYKQRTAEGDSASQKSSSDTESEQQETHPLENSGTASHPSTAEETDQPESERRDKRRRLGKNLEDQPKEGVPSGDVSERHSSSPLQAADLHSNARSRHAGTSRAGSSESTPSSAGRDDNGTAIPIWAAPNLPVMGDPLPIEPLSTSKGGDSAGPFYFLNAHRGMTDDPTVVPREAIRLAMASISSRIENHVDELINRCGIPSNQPVILDRDFAYPPECIHILRRLLGPTSYDTTAGSEMFSTFHRTKTTLGRFLRSFVVCAISTWCFECRVNEEAYHSSLGGGEVQRTFEKAFEPMLLAEMRQRLWREHLNTTVKPKIVPEAHRMASLLQTYLEFFIPSDKPAKSMFVDHVVSLPLQEPKPTEDTDAVPPRFNFDEPHESVVFRTQLALLIRDVLTWRTELSIGLDEKYMFVWPSFLTPYDPDDHQVHGAQGSAQQTEPPKDCQVLLGVMPLVCRMLRKRIGEDEWTDWQTVCRGQVIRL